MMEKSYILGLLHLKDFNIEARRVGFENVDVKIHYETPILYRIVKIRKIYLLVTKK